MKLIYATLFVLSAIRASAQFAIGTIETTVYDAVRDRDVPCLIHYPAESAGTDVPVIDGQFPVLVVGHGFVMAVEAYTYLWEHYVPLGYIVTLPDTETGFAPDHATFGGDIAFLANYLIQADADAGSPFFGHVAPDAALIGHSMGGGAAFLGAANNTAIRTVVGLAPAETSPSAVQAAGAVVVPALVFAGSEDCVTPIDAHAGPISGAVTSDCNVFVNITGGGHCYFGDNSFTCSFGELTCGPDLTISREQQHDVVTDVLDDWLRFHLLGESAALTDLFDSLATSTRYIAQSTCISTNVTDPHEAAPGPTVVQEGDGLRVRGTQPGDQLIMRDPLGRVVRAIRSPGTEVVLPLSSATTGTVVLEVISGAQRWTRLIAIMR